MAPVSKRRTNRFASLNYIFFNFFLCVCSVFGSLRVHYCHNITRPIVVLDRVDNRYPVLGKKFMLDETEIEPVPDVEQAGAHTIEPRRALCHWNMQV
jgi:hypothetical protein